MREKPMTWLTVVCLVGIILLMVVFARCDDKPAIKSSCTAVEETSIVAYDCKLVPTGEGTHTSQDCKHREIKDWQVTCKVTQGDKTLWEGKPPMAHPATRKEAFRAIEKFLDEKARAVAKGDKP